MARDEHITNLQARIASVSERIARACARAGRDPTTVRLIAVSKRKPVSAIREAYELGIRDFGENYAQELTEKHRQLADLTDLRWHLIGHLQSNKARVIAPFVHAVHTVDSIKLLRELSKRAEQAERGLQAFVEVNLAAEQQKAGCDPRGVPELVLACTETPNVELVGLMAIPPALDRGDALRSKFRQLRELARQQRPPLPRLSMGMSSDFELAIEEGATDVRVGTAIFGARDAAAQASPE